MTDFQEVFLRKKGYGIDIRANENVYGNVKIINLMEKIPLKNNCIDRVFMLAVLEHLDGENVDIVTRETSRILNNGGLFILTTPTPFAKSILEFLSFKLHLISAESIEEHKHYYTEKELINIMEKIGLETVIYKKFQFGCNELIVARKNI